MFTKVLKQLAHLDFEVLAYTMENMNCKSLDQLTDKLIACYTAEDVSRIAEDLLYAYENRK